MFAALLGYKINLILWSQWSKACFIVHFTFK